MKRQQINWTRFYSVIYNFLKMSINLSHTIIGINHSHATPREAKRNKSYELKYTNSTKPPMNSNFRMIYNIFTFFFFFFNSIFYLRSTILVCICAYWSVEIWMECPLSHYAKIRHISFNLLDSISFSLCRFNLSVL